MSDAYQALNGFESFAVATVLLYKIEANKRNVERE